MQKIIPHLWFDTEAKEAAAFYASIFPDSRVVDTAVITDTPSGDCDIVSFELFGTSFQAISAGPYFTFNSSISFSVLSNSQEEIETWWAKLSEGGTALMPLGEYPWSKAYGWTTDKYGLSWQLMLTDAPITQRIIPSLMFSGAVMGQAEEAMNMYASIFPDSSIGPVSYYVEGEAGEGREGKVSHGPFTLAGYNLIAMDSGVDHDIPFSEAVSLVVSCEDQTEMDMYTEALSAVPESEQCGWLKDKFGVSWQIVPTTMNKMMRDTDKERLARVVQVMLKMKRLNLAELQAAYDGE